LTPSRPAWGIHIFTLKTTIRVAPRAVWHGGCTMGWQMNETQAETGSTKQTPT
jgi:hypothetical protein